VRLSEEEKDFIAGKQGSGTKRAMEILVALGKVFHADRMIAVSSAQIAGVSYRNIGEAGLDFLSDWADMGATVRIPAFMNPAGIDRALWRKMGIPEHFADRQCAIIHQLERMGVQDTLTCTPYHIGHTPAPDQHIAWSESSAVSYANSVLGAKTNREGGPSALAAAITGRVPECGLHLDENRHATHHIIVKCAVETPADYSALGYHIGKIVGAGIPFFDGLRINQERWRAQTCLKALGAAMAASGAVALYHIDGVTPEAIHNRKDIVSEMKESHIVSDLNEIRKALIKSGGTLDLVALGCPHVSLDELNNIAEIIGDDQLKTPLWITTSKQIRCEADAAGITSRIQNAGGLIIADTCMVVAPLDQIGYRHIAVDSAKAACYLPSHQGAHVYWGSTEQCIEAARKGQWTS
jgi:predicted aconitase